MGHLEALRARLADHRERGADFAAAWTAGTATIVDESWLDVLDETRSVWADAYERRPASARVLAIAGLNGRSDGVPLDRLRCAHCRGPLPPEWRSKYCGQRCARRARR